MAQRNVARRYISHFISPFWICGPKRSSFFWLSTCIFQICFICCVYVLFCCPQVVITSIFCCFIFLVAMKTKRTDCTKCYTYILEFINETLKENGLYLRFVTFNGVMIAVGWQCWCTPLIILRRWRYTVLKMTSVDLQIHCFLSCCWVTPVRT